jgi:hypothetical protein
MCHHHDDLNHHQHDDHRPTDDHLTAVHVHRTDAVLLPG